MSLPPPLHLPPTRVRRQGQLTVGWAPASSPLTRREVDVLRLIAAGLTDRQIAVTLCVSRKTASNHVANILRKLGAATRASAASYAVRAGLA